MGKPNQLVPAAPLQPISVCGEPFSHVLVDCVGPLPKTKLGNQYLLTIMCKFTHFPEAIPLRNIKAPKIVESLIKFFTFVGLPASLQSDQGSNFMSNIMQQVLYQLGIKQFKSSAYQPESQGAIERFHQTQILIASGEKVLLQIANVSIQMADDYTYRNNGKKELFTSSSSSDTRYDASIKAKKGDKSLNECPYRSSLT